MTKERAEELRDIVCRHAGLTVDLLTDRGRYRDQVIARMVLAGVLREYGMPLSSIGRMMNRSHPAVLWQLRNLDDALETGVRDVTVLWREVTEELNNHDDDEEE